MVNKYESVKRRGNVEQKSGRIARKRAVKRKM